MEEVMRDPTPSVWFAVQRGILNVNVLVSRVEVDVPYRRLVASGRVGDINLGEEGWEDEVHILAAHGV